MDVPPASPRMERVDWSDRQGRVSPPAAQPLWRPAGAAGAAAPSYLQDSRIAASRSDPTLAASPAARRRRARERARAAWIRACWRIRAKRATNLHKWHGTIVELHRRHVAFSGRKMKPHLPPIARKAAALPDHIVCAGSTMPLGRADDTSLLPPHSHPPPFARSSSCRRVLRPRNFYLVPLDCNDDDRVTNAPQLTVRFSRKR